MTLRTLRGVVSRRLRAWAWRLDPDTDRRQALTVRWLTRTRRGTRSWRSVLRDDPCAYCGSRATTVDHVVPRADHGPDTWENLTASCVDCNRGKGRRRLVEFLRHRYARHQPTRRPPKSQRIATIGEVARVTRH